MELVAPTAIHPRSNSRFMLDSPSLDSELTLSDEERPEVHSSTTSTQANLVDDRCDEGSGDDYDEPSAAVYADETRLKYSRLQARGRAAELAYTNKLIREKELERATQRERTTDRERSRSASRSRSRPSTPIFGALFKRSDSLQNEVNSSRPVTPVIDKSSRRSSISNLFKFSKPISRSSSSKTIYSGAASDTSSRPSSPFPSPLTPLSPLPFLFSPKSKRKAIPNSGEDPPELAGFGSPLARISRRPSPPRSFTMPDTYYTPQTIRKKRDPSPGDSLDYPSTPTPGANMPHLIFSGETAIPNADSRLFAG